MVEQNLPSAVSQAGTDHQEGRKHPAVAVGLTGGIGAGKSTALSLFAEEGARTISADDIVHELYTRPEVRQALVERFGPDILDENGAVDRRRLSARVQGRIEELRWLEGLTHPLVRVELERFIQEAPAGTVVVCEVPLLVESQFTDLFDLVVSIEARQEHRLARSRHRFASEVFTEFEDLQASSEQRAARSHLVYHNDGSVDHMRSFVKRAYADALALLRTKCLPLPATTETQEGE